ncbi:MAG: serine/threonine protein kinase [Actinomycetota bacterium]|nr:serine/threonine protein kinase [Actinomycetota bacterium]
MALVPRGRRISDTLVVDRLLGEGAYAEVHRVRHDFLGWQAMKLFKAVASLTETRAMLDEARLLSTLGHPNIVRLFDANTLQTTDGKRGFFTMEYVAGGSLERLVRAHAATMVPLDVAVDAIEQITAALGVAHRQSPPILHRDLTLANVLVGYDDTGMRVRLSDFGLSKRADPVTHLASAQGTLAFMAPEVQRGDGYTRASDVWSLGTIAYLLLTNHYPFHDGDPFDSFSLARFRRPALAPSRYNDAVDKELDRIVLGALERDPRDRIGTAQLLGEELRRRRSARTAAPEVRREGEAELPTNATPREQRAQQLADQALALARHPATLHEAADLMEEAVNCSARLRARYLDRLTLWRRGVMM